MHFRTRSPGSITSIIPTERTHLKQLYVKEKLRHEPLVLREVESSDGFTDTAQKASPLSEYIVRYNYRAHRMQVLPEQLWTTEDGFMDHRG
ncbi:hypothetical protein NDU88_004687 [Pleurodeles waltl]|uniref:Uncharacterized protein n=1 Tax=Pleurodeles waltl TaxID=8319 RepID=A0AAV7KZ39_PLEWA|nr:hypothetical protein NDU88_004687 [Pleurodeles waltl]